MGESSPTPRPAKSRADDNLAPGRRGRRRRARREGYPHKAIKENNAEFYKKIETLKAKNVELETEVGAIEDETAALGHRLGSMEYEKDQCQQWANDAEEKALLAKTQLQALQSLSKHPETLRQVVDLIERLHAGRIYFTPRAKMAADDASITDMRTAWRLVWAMATRLHDLYFGAKKTNSSGIERDFRATTTFELSLTEGKQTKVDNQLMSLCKDQWNDG